MAHMDETERIARLEQVVIPQAHHEILGRCAESHLERFVPSGVQRAAHLMREAISGHQIASREFRSKWGAASGARCWCVAAVPSSRARQRCRSCVLPKLGRSISGHQRSSEAIRGHQRSSEVIRGHQRSSEVIRCTV